MWPKMLLEFLPHLTRLIPAADNYLNSRKDSDRAYQAALSSLGDDIRNGLAKVSEDQGALRRDVQAHVANSAQLSADAARARVGVEALDTRVSELEKRLISISRLLWVAIVMLILLAVVVGIRAIR